jgi:hypothetical protein
MNNKYEVEKLNMTIQKYSNIHNIAYMDKIVDILYKLQVIDIKIYALWRNNITWMDGLVEVS